MSMDAMQLTQQPLLQLPLLQLPLLLPPLLLLIWLLPLLLLQGHSVLKPGVHSVHACPGICWALIRAHQGYQPKPA